jgi:hypothetical protein
VLLRPPPTISSLSFPPSFLPLLFILTPNSLSHTPPPPFPLYRGYLVHPPVQALSIQPAATRTHTQQIPCHLPQGWALSGTIRCRKGTFFHFRIRIIFFRKEEKYLLLVFNHKENRWRGGLKSIMCTCVCWVFVRLCVRMCSLSISRMTPQKIYHYSVYLQYNITQYKPTNSFYQPSLSDTSFSSLPLLSLISPTQSSKFEFVPLSIAVLHPPSVLPTKYSHEDRERRRKDSSGRALGAGAGVEVVRNGWNGHTTPIQVIH